MSPPAMKIPAPAAFPLEGPGVDSVGLVWVGEGAPVTDGSAVTVADVADEGGLAA